MNRFYFTLLFLIILLLVIAAADILGNTIYIIIDIIVPTVEKLLI